MTAATQGQACADSGGKVCNASGTCVPCNWSDDCGATPLLCTTPECTPNGCVTVSAGQGAPCASGGGIVCDVGGKCVGCVAASGCSGVSVCDQEYCVGCDTAADCPKQQTACKVSVCASSACSAQNVTQGTACSDSGGTICNGSGLCVPACSTSSQCPASCSAGKLSPGSCAGTFCGYGAPAACPGGFICADTTSCKTSCGVDGDCASPTLYCAGGVCVGKGGVGAACAAADQCASGVCGTSGKGHCCTAPCSTAGGACGATDCDASGTCVFPGGATSCDDCSGSMLTPGTCGGAGACAYGATTACAGHLLCADTTSCLRGCGPDSAAGDANCTSGWCNGAGAGATQGVCLLPEASGASCNRHTQCSSGTCCSTVGSPAGCTAANQNQCL